MKNSFFFNCIRKLIFKQKPKNSVLNKSYYLFLNSNPWFSAVTDYSLQLCLYFKKNNIDVLYGAEKNSTAMDLKCKEHNIPFFYIPIHNLNIINYVISFVKIFKLLSETEKKIKYIFVFEGREQSILILTKILFPFLWHNKKLIRIRGQTQAIKAGMLSVITYNYYTDKIIFAAQCVLNRVQFEIPKNKYIIQHYCKDVNFIEHKLNEFNFSEKIPKLNFECPTFLVLGRFDEVKGHDMVVQAFLNAEFSTNCQLVFIGKSENVSAKSIYEKYKILVDFYLEDNNLFYLNNKNNSIFIIDEKFENIYNFIQNVHFGVISSLDSEVVCRVGVEFLQCGVPCLYSDAGALTEVFVDFPELNFLKGNVNSLGELFQKAASIISNKNEFEELKQKCFKIGNEKYSTENYKKVLDSL